MRRARWIFCIALLAATPTRADVPRPDEPIDSSQRDESRAAFRRGVQALQKQQWIEARDAFMLAFKLFPHPSILLDLGIARSHTGDALQAEQDLTRFLAEDTGATADELQTARTTLQSVRNQLGTLRVRVSPPGATATLDGKPVALVSGTLIDVRVTRGDHTLEAAAPDHVAWSGHVSVDGGEPKVVDLTLAGSTRNDKPGLGTQRIVSIVMFGAAAVSAGIATVAGVRAIDLANQYDTMTDPNYQNPNTKSEGITFRTASDVTFVVAAAFAVAGVVLFVTAPKSAARVALTPFGASLRF